MTHHEYIHASQHVGMGCGPMQECSVCKATGAIPTALGEVPESCNSINLQKIIVVSMITAVLGEIFIRPIVIPAVRKLIGKANPFYIPSEQSLKEDAKRVLEWTYGKPANRFGDREKEELKRKTRQASDNRISLRILPDRG